MGCCVDVSLLLNCIFDFGIINLMLLFVPVVLSRSWVIKLGGVVWVFDILLLLVWVLCFGVCYFIYLVVLFCILFITCDSSVILLY